MALLVALPQLGLAQGLPAQLTGIVQDQTNAVIPGATITLTHETTGAVRRTVSNAEGYFSIVGIPAGQYRVLVEAKGFNKWERTGMIFHAGDRLTLTDIVLTVAPTAEQVEVIASAATVIPVDTGEKAQVITSTQIQNLAVLGRSADELLKILPGVVYTNPDDPGTPAGFTVQFNRGIGNYNVAGTRNTQVANVSDGANVIDPGCNCGSAVTPNMDMLQEVKVQVSNFAAENALGPVVFNAVSKSGSSEFHGEAYLYARHHSLNARDWRNNFFKTKKPTDSFYYPGFNIGG
ncbi:MAG: carboxypeptidase-like regulatory domain-containing protein, partial [Bryobacteraceae bacterium]|nr:carboxypeptidase-like regulatory domain-containing protein [Bryobacteraceae bacterium]